MTGYFDITAIFTSTSTLHLAFVAMQCMNTVACVACSCAMDPAPGVNKG